MTRIWETYKKIILAFAIVLIGVAIFMVLKLTKPEVPLQQVEERFWPIAVEAVVLQTLQPNVTAFGEIRAGREAELRPQVSGNVISVSSRIGDGVSVQKGDVLLNIDDFDYVATMQERRADLAEAEAKLNELEAVLAGEEKLLPGDKNQVEIAKRELDRQAKLLKRSAVSKKAHDDAQSSLNDRRQNVLVREQTLARLKTQIIQSRSAVEKAKTALAKAERDVEDTRLTAPFDGFLTDMDVTEGKQVSTSDRLGRLISLSNLEVSFHLPEGDFARLTREGPLTDRTITVMVRQGNAMREYPAVINRIDARVDAATGGRKVFAILSGLTLETDLRPGLFVEVAVPDAVYENVVRLPRQSLHDGSQVYVVDDGRLSYRPVVVATFDKDHVLIKSGLQAGDQVAVTRFAEMGEGVKVKVVSP